jgi:xylulokinase
VSSQSWGVVPINEKGDALRPALLWLDRRSAIQSKDIEKRLRKNGSDVLVDSSFIVPKIVWIRDHEPDLYQRTYKFLQVNSFINFKLCSVPSMDASQEDPLQIFIRNSPHPHGIMDFYDSLGLSPEKMTDATNSNTVIGTVTRDAANETGLAEGTPVVAGAMDTSASALGMRIIEHGQTLHVAGQAGAIGVCLGRPLFDRRLCIHNHVIPGKWLVVGVMVATGASMRWVRDLFGLAVPSNSNGPSTDPFQELSNEAARSRAGADGVIYLPYLQGERTPIWDNNARGIFFGLSLNTKKEHLIRAVMEGVAFALRHNIEAMKSMGIDIDEIYCAGGATNSSIWNQIKSDITKKTLICIGRLPAATLGAAVLAGMGIGVYAKYQPFDMPFMHLETYSPNVLEETKYDQMFRIYLNLYANLKREFKALSDVGN